jgi:pimeloyl-ACP methyl ester carboxylesterase
MTQPAGPEFRWLERGEGEPVVLLHGLLGQMHDWDDVLDALADTCRAFAPTLPLFDERLSDVSIESLARWVVELLDALAIDRAVVGGNSLGGHVALEVALTAPERVSGLVLTGSSGLFERGFSRGVPHRPTPDYVRARMEEAVYDRALVTAAWVEAVRATVIRPATARRVVRFARAARRGNLEDRLGGIDVPALLVWGADDRITPPEVGGRFHALIPDARLVVLPRCGHAPMLERPEAFALPVRRWLHDTRARRGNVAPPLRAARAVTSAPEARRPDAPRRPKVSQ